MQTSDWSDFQFFLAIAQTGQLSKAGTTLGVDGTTIGRRLRRLEANIGATLFEQTREGQVLTEAGERLLVSVEAMAKAALAAENNKVRQADSELSGILRISVSEGFGSWFLAGHIPDFIAAHPRLTLDLVANSGFLSLSKREADVAVMLSRPAAGPIIASKLSDYALRLYATPDYLAETGVPSSPEELTRGYRLIGYIPDMIYAPELRYLDEIHPGLTISIRSSSINAQHHLIAAGSGLGVLPCFIGDADPLLMAVLPEHQITRSFWMVTHKDTHQLARVRAGREWIKKAVQSDRASLLPNQH
jgi:DNA-binding transcriptional LysR family regulator